MRGKEKVHSSRKLLGTVPDSKSSESFGGSCYPDWCRQGHRWGRLTLPPELGSNDREKRRGTLGSTNIALRQSPSFFCGGI